MKLREQFYSQWHQKRTEMPGMVAHACNPTYSGGRDQEDHGSKPVQASSSQDPVSTKPIKKRGWWSSNPSTANK
jgi:hypothetical protein